MANIGKAKDGLFHRLCRISKNINSAYSFQILFILVLSFFVLTFDLFFVICNVSMKPVFGIDTGVFHVIKSLLNSAIILTILMAAELPVKEVRKYLRKQLLTSSCHSQSIQISLYLCLFVY